MKTSFVICGGVGGESGTSEDNGTWMESATYGGNGYNGGGYGKSSGQRHTGYGGGGGGWYGGYATNHGQGGGGGGSGWIGGMDSGETIAGNASFPSPIFTDASTRANNETGHDSYGYAIITLYGGPW